VKDARLLLAIRRLFGQAPPEYLLQQIGATRLRRIAAMLIWADANLPPGLATGA